MNSYKGGNAGQIKRINFWKFFVCIFLPDLNDAYDDTMWICQKGRYPIHFDGEGGDNDNDDDGGDDNEIGDNDEIVDDDDDAEV